MSLNPQEIGPIPEETARVARAAYPKGNVWMRMRDELGPIYQDEAFAHLFSHTGQPAEAPWRLALVTVMPFARSAFPIGRPPMRCGDGSTSSTPSVWNSPTPGFDHTVLAEFRTRLVVGNSDQLLSDTMLTLFKERGWRHPRAASNVRIRRRCWLRSARRVACCVWENPCAMR